MDSLPNQLSPPTEMEGGSGERTPTTEVVTYKPRGLENLHHVQMGQILSSGGVAALAGSWYGLSRRASNRPWHNSPR
jgi:hypothetical protein